MLLVLASLTPSRSDACATVDHGALSTGVTHEEAVIVFDPATKTQHFIRAASFSTRGSSDFGFAQRQLLVPIDDNYISPSVDLITSS